MQNITYSEAVKMNIETVQPVDHDVVADVQSVAVNKTDESIAIPVADIQMPSKPIQVRKISRFQVSHVQEENIMKLNAAQQIAPVEVNY